MAHWPEGGRARSTAWMRTVSALAALHGAMAYAVTTERLPIAMTPVTVAMSLASDHAIEGIVSSTLGGLPGFDTRLGSLDLVVVTPSVRYDLPSLLYTVTTLADSGHARVSTLLDASLDQWVRDVASDARLEPLTQDIWHAATCGGCWPSKGDFGSFGFTWGEDDAEPWLSLAAVTPKAQGIAVLSTQVSLSANTISERVNMQLTGAWTWAGSLGIARTYHAYTTVQYVQNAVSRATGSSLDRAWMAADELVSLRSNIDAATSAANEALRSAEYGVMGFVGAADFRNDPSLKGLIALVYQSPLGVAGHNTIKACKAWVPGCASLWSAVVGLFGQNPTGPLPESRPGGFDANRRGWLHGLFHPDDVDGLAEAIGNGVVVPPVADPLLPNTRIQLPGGGEFLHFERQVEPGHTLYLDPEPGSVYLTFASGAGIVALELPDLLGSQSIASFTLTAKDRSIVLQGGQLHDLVAMFGTSLDGFAISGLQGPLLPEHLIIGLRFDRAGTVDIAQITMMQPVPEPAVGWMLATGLLFLALRRRCFAAMRSTAKQESSLTALLSRDLMTDKGRFKSKTALISAPET